MTPAQRRLLERIRTDVCPEYWPVVNDWVRDKGPAASLALHNINRVVAALVRDGYVTITDDGLFELTEKGQNA